MNDVLPQYKGPGGDFTVADYNALVRAIRRATPVQGPGTRVTRSEGGSVISVPERRFAPVRVSEDALYPFKLSVVNAATTQNPSYRYLVYIPSGALYCSGVEGSCVNQLYGSDGWRRISIDTEGAFAQDSTEYPIYLVGRFAYATEEHKEVVSATYVITTNSDPRYVSALGDYDSENAFRYYACKIGTMTQKGASSQLVCGSIVFMAPAEGGEGGGGGTQAAFEVRKTANGRFIVYLPPGCLAYKNVSVGGTASLNAPYTIVDADRELFTVEDESSWYLVANGYNGATGGDIHLQAAYSSGSVTFAVVFGSSRVDGVGSNAGTGTDEDNYQSTLIAKVSSGEAHQVVHSAVRFYGIHGTLSSSDRQQLKDELEEEVEQAVEDAQAAATEAAGSASAAASSATAAAGSATSAAGSATAAAGSATDAAGSASDAAGSASDAADSASAAASIATAAAGSATSAANAATAAGASAAAAAGSATAAAGSAATASSKATAAAGSASDAAGSASDAAGSASDAAQSAQDAAQSASDAASSATTASGAATSAAGSASAAARSASSASSSASSANTSAQAATTAALNANSSASDAANSATAADGSASDAAGSASDAAGSASDAAQSAADAAQSAQDAANAVSAEAIADAVEDAIEALQQNGTIPTLAPSGVFSDSCYSSTELGTTGTIDGG